MAETGAPPPSYAQATATAQTQRTSQKSQNRSSGDILPLPPGWIRQYDQTHDHFFYVDTTAETPRSVWEHPYRNEEYLQKLPPEERDRITSLIESSTNNVSESSMPIDAQEVRAKVADSASSSNTHGAADLTSGISQDPSHGKKTFGRKMKDKLTGTTHDEREQYRWQRRQEEERQATQQIQLREAVERAEASGVPQHIGRDNYGHELYVEPSYSTYPYQTGGYGPMGRVNGYPGSGPYAQHAFQPGPYGDPNARFVRVQRGGSFGSGYGLPIAGGVLGGLLLGGLLAGPF